MSQANYRSKTGVTVLIECLKNADPTSRQFACDVLGNIGPDATAALARLRELTSDMHPAIRQAAHRAVTQIETRKE